MYQTIAIQCNEKKVSNYRIENEPCKSLICFSRKRRALSQKQQFPKIKRVLWFVVSFCSLVIDKGKMNLLIFLYSQALF